MNKFEELEFVNVQDTTEEVDDDEIKKVNEDNKDLLSVMKSALTINDIKFSDKLKNHPVALTSVGEVSLEMEKVLKAMPNSTGVKANKVLLINTNHPVYEKLVSLHNNKDDDGVKEYTNVLYNMALLINGLSVDNPNELTETICNIISK